MTAPDTPARDVAATLAELADRIEAMSKRQADAHNVDGAVGIRWAADQVRETAAALAPVAAAEPAAGDSGGLSEAAEVIARAWYERCGWVWREMDADDQGGALIAGRHVANALADAGLLAARVTAAPDASEGQS